MEITLYLDVYFLANFLMDLLLLDLTGHIPGVCGAGSGQKPARLVGAAAAGAAWTCAMTVLFFALRADSVGGRAEILCSAAEFLLQVPVPAALMLLLAFGRAAPRIFVLRLAALLAAGAFLGGVLELAAERMENGADFLFGQVLNRTEAPDGRSRLWIVQAAAALTAAAGLRVFLNVLETVCGRRRLLCRVVLENAGKRMEVTALCDSGNRLFEPYGHAPVHVVDRSVGLALLNRESRAALIPYRSVGKAGGLLWGFRIDRMTVEQEDVGDRIYSRPWIALSPVPVSPEGRYEMLLHGEE